MFLLAADKSVITHCMENLIIIIIIVIIITTTCYGATQPVLNTVYTM